jgi:hypothetical protein
VNTEFFILDFFVISVQQPHLVKLSDRFVRGDKNNERSERFSN